MQPDNYRLGSRIHVLMMVISALVGWFIPNYYDWTGADQSRPSWLIPFAAAIVVILGVAAMVSLPWLSIVEVPDQNVRPATSQLTLRSVFLITGVIALAIAAHRQLPNLVVPGIVMALTLGYLVYTWARHPSLRLPLATLLGCMYLPFAWLASDTKLGDLVGMMIATGGGVSVILPTMLIGRGILDEHISDLGWLSMLLCSIQLAIGTWLVSLGPKRGIAFMISSMVLSMLGSMVMNMMMRI